MIKILHEDNSIGSFTAYLIRVSYKIPYYTGKYWLAGCAWMMRISYFLSLKRKKPTREATLFPSAIIPNQFVCIS